MTSDTGGLTLHLSSRAGVHGPQPCIVCGRPTHYWYAPTRVHYCVRCGELAEESAEEAAGVRESIARVLGRMEG